MRCEYCDKEIKSYGHLGQCKEYKKILDSTFSYENLYEMYVIKEMSALEISQCMGISNPGTIISRINKLGIKSRSIKESTSTNRTKSKRAETNIERYGTANTFCRESASRKKWQDRLLKEEGITNVFQRKDVKEKIVNTLIDKYGVESSSNITTSRGKNTYSSIHREVVKLLNKLNVKFDIEFKLKHSGRWYLSYDIKIKNTNKLIEVNGDYWHGNPVIYKPTDLILKGSSGEIPVWMKWESDRDKINHALKHGYSVLVIWEYDLKNNLDFVERILYDYAAS